MPTDSPHAGCFMHAKSSQSQAKVQVNRDVCAVEIEVELSNLKVCYHS